MQRWSDHKSVRGLWWGWALLLLSASGAGASPPALPPVPMGQPCPDIYYSPWKYDAAKDRYVCCLYFKATPSDRNHDWHYCYYYPKQSPSKIYFCDRVTTLYWGCYDTRTRGFCLVDSAQRARDWQAIPPSAYSEPGPLPKILRNVDGATVPQPPELPDPSRKE